MNFGFRISDLAGRPAVETVGFIKPSTSLAAGGRGLGYSMKWSSGQVVQWSSAQKLSKFEIRNSKLNCPQLTIQLFALLMCLPFFACTPAPVRPTAPPVRYLELATAYNRNVALINQLWARADIEMRWQHKGKRQRETGEGHLMLMPPDRVAISVGKLGQTLFWAGCDADEYWLFDLRDDGVVYVGRHENFNPKRIDVLPIPVRPLDVTTLLGLVYLPLGDAEQDTVLVGVDGADWVVDLPQRRLRLTIDPATFTARSVHLTNEKGQVIVASELRDPVQVEMQNNTKGNAPRLPSRVTIRVPPPGMDGEVRGEFDAVVKASSAGQKATEQPGQLTLRLSGLTDGREDERIRPRQFDLPALYRAYKPGKVIDLDSR